MAGRSLRGTVVASANFNAEHDANTLRTAMKGAGRTDCVCVVIIPLESR